MMITTDKLREALKLLHDKTAELIAHLQATDRLRPCFNLPALEAARSALADHAAARAGKPALPTFDVADPGRFGLMWSHASIVAYGEAMAAWGASQAAAPQSAEPVAIFCPEKSKPGGCQLHNLQCGWPECNSASAQPAAQPLMDDERRDAERYRWLRDKFSVRVKDERIAAVLMHQLFNRKVCESESVHWMPELDAAIDAAMSAKGQR